MTSDGCGVAVDGALAALRAARNRPAVLKLQLAKLRSAVPNLPVLAFEGDDDKIVYGQWLKRARPDLSYVDFPCNGKTPLLALRSVLSEDVTGLSKGIYFFVDRDFDDLRGQDGGADIFMTNMYSVENYLTDNCVVDSLLKVEFHCHLSPELRAVLVKKYSENLDKFLEHTAPVNRRLFYARRCGIDIKPLPTAIGKIATVGIDSILPGSLAIEAAVFYIGQEPSVEVCAALDGEFEQLDPRSRYRGKFSLLFMKSWLSELALQNSMPDRGLFKSLTNNSAFRMSELTLTRFSSQSPLPAGFEEFVDRIS